MSEYKIVIRTGEIDKKELEMIRKHLIKSVVYIEWEVEEIKKE